MGNQKQGFFVVKDKFFYSKALLLLTRAASELSTTLRTVRHLHSSSRTSIPSFIHSQPENRTLQGTDEKWPLSISSWETTGFSLRSTHMMSLEGHNRMKLIRKDTIR